ncbi:MAG: PBP1A family penicillin-binding protein [Gemmatimonadaceae bacterium]|nr:PBP1A family penicillin-binding protein [Gemmatimonadaceae bacterium]
MSRLILCFALAAGPLAAQGSDPAAIVPLPQSSMVLARDGTVIGEFGRQVRTSVAIASLPRHVGQAFVAVEDHRFYQHDGVDMVGVAAAVKDAVLGNARGASTITQQLVGNMHPDIIDRRDASIGRKLREQSAARDMERRYTKAQILEAYLNTIHFGHGWYGIDAAARHYFGKPATRLSLAEAATLAAMPKGPALYDPVRFPDRVRERRNLVLALMEQQRYITAAEKAAAQAAPLVTTRDSIDASFSYMVNVARVQAERGGVNLRDGGYRVLTTLDPTLQRAAARALREVVAKAEATVPRRRTRKGAPAAAPAPAGTLQGAVVMLSPFTGEVLALVGGRDFAASAFDRVIDGRRQPGSSFKPFVYGTALLQGVPANTIVQDTALQIALPTGRTYAPENSDGKFLGPLTLREALVQSRNPVAVQLGMQVTIDSIAALAHRMGLEATIAPYPSSAIGTASVRPLDMAAAYAVIANGGSSVKPRFVTRVEDRGGRVVWSPRIAAPQYALDTRVAFVLREMMRDVVERGTATAVRRLVPARIPVAGKTGTTNGSTDVWFVGMTPELVGAVWVGYDTPRPISGGQAAGGTVAAPIFGRTVQAFYTAGRSSMPWTPPPGVVSAELDRVTGLPASDSTPPARRYTEWFVAGTEPGAIPVDIWKLMELGGIGR